MRRSQKLDMTSGGVFGKLLVFALPLIATGVLQLLYNAADMIIVGKYDGKEALAAVGSTGSLVNLLVNLFMGLSVGASVLVAQEYGARNIKALSDVVHTSMSVSVIAGILVCLLGLFAAEPMLVWMGAPSDVLDQSVLYLKIYFLGMPASMVYNYGASIMRGAGDTRRPLVYLTLSGLVNVVLNYVLVRFFHMGVAGVAIATAVSQVVAAIMVVVSLMRSDDDIRLELKKLRIKGRVLWSVMRIGLPAGLQGAVFSISNVIIQSSINSFGSTVMAGCSAAASIEGFVYTCMNSIGQAALTFTGQNYGARKPDRILKVVGCSLTQAATAGIVVGYTALIFGPQLLSLYNSDPEVIEMGMVRMRIICTTHFMCGVMDVLSGAMRGMGYSMVPTLVSLSGACGLRILWIYTVFAANPLQTVLYASYPVTWIFTIVLHTICFIIFYNMMKKKMQTQESALQAADYE
ncbi:MAG: MATE family efflux transporter [Ruminococcaceae bacterium]|nr:MATE family efflux transporter [Oscillospiraceae bacterium]